MAILITNDEGTVYNMGWFDKKDDDRSHQDNCKWSEVDHQEWDNKNYQYCRFCGGSRPFKYDRCIVCHNN